ncbi:MAG: PilZ domain-containing protein [Candidatus Omnitrophica bacterium]|nr:PilZ domain-containing protein [Candidatus Omnitrophota bacterium]
MFPFRLKGFKCENTRQYPRLPAAWPMKCRVVEPRPGAEVLLSTEDVSAGGTAVLVRDPIPAGSRLAVEIHVPPLNRTISTGAEVVRCLPKPREGFEVGLRFREISAQDREDLEGVIEQFFSPSERTRQRGIYWRQIN